MAKAKAPAAPSSDKKPTADEVRHAEWEEAGRPESHDAPEVEAHDQEIKPEPTPPPQVQKHPKRLVREALEWGFSQAQIDSTSSDDLDDQVYEAQRQFRLAQQRQQEAIQNRDRQPPSRAPEVERDDLDEAFEGWDDDTKRRLKKLDTRKEIAELKQRLQEYEERDRQREVRTVQQRLVSKSKEHGLSKHQESAMLGYLQGLQKSHADDLESDFDEGVKLFGFGKKPPVKADKPDREADPEPVTSLTAEERELERRKEQWVKGGTARGSYRDAESNLSDRDKFIAEWKKQQRVREAQDAEWDKAHGLNGT